jgi:2-methylcitrate dehydratase PrpD
MPDAASRHACRMLGEFVAGSAWSDIDGTPRQAVTRSVLNHLGCALGVARDPAVATMLAVMRGVAGTPAATVIGQGLRLDPMSAAFLNAIASNLLDYDDTHLPTVIHPSAPVVPPALALAEQRGLSGPALLHAVLLGAEVACRIGNAVSPGHYARGWHITATCGVFGAAAASAKLLGLDAVRTAHAIGIAASQSAGLVANLATAAKNVAVGNAARHGLLAALLAEQGLEAAPAALEGPLGWAAASGDAFDAGALLAGLDQDWEVARNTFKPYPAGIVFHAVIDACLELRGALDLPPDAIDRVTVAGDALLLARGDRAVANERDARVSIHHCTAVALLRGRAGVAEFGMEAVADPAIAAMRGQVEAALDDGLPRGAARVSLVLRDGREISSTVVAARGSGDRPMSDAELDAKFIDNATLGGFGDRAAAQCAAIRGLDQAASIGPLMALLA